MTLPEVIEAIIKTPSGGVMTDENKLDRDFVADKIHQARAMAIQQWYDEKRKKGGTIYIHELWLQKYVPTFDANIQVVSDCIVRFVHPPVVNLGPDRDGFEYVGKKNGKEAFTRVKAGMKAVFSQHPLTSGIGLIIWDWEMDEFSLPVIEIEGQVNIKQLMTKAIWNDPTQHPNYRYEHDEYPITAELIPLMERHLFNLHTNIIVSRRADVTQNSQDDSNLQAKK